MPTETATFPGRHSHLMAYCLHSTYQDLKSSHSFSGLPQFYHSPPTRTSALSILFSTACPSLTSPVRCSKTFVEKRKGGQGGAERRFKGLSDVPKVPYSGRGRTEPPQSELFYHRLFLTGFSGGAQHRAPGRGTHCELFLPQSGRCAGSRTHSPQPPVCKLAAVGDS